MPQEENGLPGDPQAAKVRHGDEEEDESGSQADADHGESLGHAAENWQSGVAQGSGQGVFKAGLEGEDPGGPGPGPRRR